MLDLHMTHIVANGIRYFSADRSIFDNLFPGVGEPLKARMFTWLQSHKVQFDLGYAKLSTQRLPLITVELTEALYDSQGLANMSGAYHSPVGQPLSETKYVHEFSSQECRINVYAGEVDGLRVLHAIVKASVLIWTPSLVNAGYQNVLYLGTSALELEPALRSEGGMGVYGRQCVYAALHLLELPFKIEDVNNIGAADPLLDIQVQQSKYTAAELPSGVAGGVDVN